MNTKAIFASTKTVVETPQYLFDELDKEFYFETDVCALPENAKCKKFYTPEMDGLKQEWTGVCWCNPPYGRVIANWVKKAAESKATTVMLLPNRTEAPWFHEYILGKAEVRFIRGRVKFVGEKYNAPFGSMIVVFRGEGVNG